MHLFLEFTIKEEKRELEELKKEIQNLQNAPQKEAPASASKPENVKAHTKQPKQPSSGRTR